MTNAPAVRHSRKKIALTMIAAAVLAGCAVTPPAALTQQELVLQNQTDRQAMFAAQEPIAQPLTLDQAIARAVKYNLQQRLALMERALEEDLVEVQNQGMLPKLTARAGLRTRNNDSASSSESIRTHSQSLEPSTSQERNGHTADLQLSWNVLDFGLSYFGAKAQGNKVLAAEERRRRVVADIIRQTRTAYWNAVTAERLKERVAQTLGQTQQALDVARQTEQRRLISPLAALRYQRDLLSMARQLEALNSDLMLAKSRLSALMNLAPDTPFQLADAGASLSVPSLPYQRADLESLSMINRPELREEGYLARNAVLETRMSLLRLLPNAALFSGLNYDSNKYAVNNSWADAGVQVSWNLLSVLSWSAVERSGKSREQLAEMRRQALRMTVLTQVNVAWLERQRAETAFQQASELSRLQDAIQRQTENAVKSSAETPLELVRARVETLLSEHARDVSYAELLNAQSTVYQAAGIDAMPERIADTSVASLAQGIAQTNLLIEQGKIEIPRFDTVMVASALPQSDSVTAAAVVPAAPLSLRKIAGSPWSSLGSVMSQAADDHAK
jgi:outer membrane protein TolC